MRLTVLLFIALLIPFFTFLAGTNFISSGEEYMQFSQVSMRFQERDAVISISYDLDMFSGMYVFLLGTHNLKPAINMLFMDFGEVEVLEIGKDNAVVLAKNVSRQNDAYYLHDSRELGGTVKLLTIVYPDGSTRTITNARATPDTFYTE